MENTTTATAVKIQPGAAAVPPAAAQPAAAAPAATTPSNPAPAATATSQVAFAMALTEKLSFTDEQKQKLNDPKIVDLLKKLDVGNDDEKLASAKELGSAMAPILSDKQRSTLRIMTGITDMEGKASIADDIRDTESEGLPVWAWVAIGIATVGALALAGWWLASIMDKGE